MEGQPTRIAAVGEVGEDVVPIQQYIHILKTYRWTVIAAVAICLGVGVLYTFKQRPLYRATALLLMENTPAVLPNVNAAQQIQTWDPDYLETQLDILVNDAGLLKEVAKRTGLVDEMRRAYEKRRQAEGDDDDDSSQGEEHENELDGEDPWAEAEVPPQEFFERQAALALRSQISVRARSKGKSDSGWYKAATQLAEISIVDNAPHRAAAIANGLCAFFVESKTQRGHQANSSAIAWLREQVDTLATKLRTAELQLNEYKRKNNVMFGSVEDGRSVLMTQVTAISRSLSTTRMERMKIEAELETLLRARAAGDMRTFLRDEAEGESPENLAKKFDELHVELVSLGQRYGPLHPKYKEIRATLSAIEARYEKRANEVIDGLGRRLDAARAYEGELVAALDDVKDDILSLQKKELGYNHYEWEVDTTKRLHGMVLQRLKETELAGRLQTDNVRVLQPALVPKRPVRPRVSVNVMVALLLGLGIGVALAFLQFYLDDSARSADELSAALGVPFLGTIPNPARSAVRPRGVLAWIRGETKMRPQDAELFVHRRPNDSASEYWRTVRTNLLFMSPDRAVRSLAVTSAEAGAGKTTVSVNLAVVMSQTQGRTLIVDADMRSPRLHRIFGVPNDSGLSVAVTGECGLDDAIKATEVAQLDVLTSGRPPPNPVELLHSERFAELSGQIASRYELIIFDTPPALGFAEAAVLGQRLDGLILVARWRKTGLDELRDLRMQLKELNVPIVGAVLNAVDMERRNHYYAYRYHQDPNAFSAAAADRS